MQAVGDLDAIADVATYDDPRQYPPGIEHVIVNGVEIIAAGKPVENVGPELPGRALRFNG